MRPTVLLDVDPGHDDLLAMAVADAFADLALVTTAAGNAPLDETTRTSLRGAGALGIAAPVVAGNDGAATAIVEHATPGSWIIAVAPPTNVAAALALDDALASRLAGISIMGGDWSPGADPARERNHAFDPPATEAVATSGARLVRCGLDLTTQVRADAAWIGSLGPPMLRASLEQYARTHTHRDARGTPLHDPCAVLAVTHPQLFAFEEVAVGISVARTADAPAVLDVIREAVNRAR